MRTKAQADFQFLPPRKEEEAAETPVADVAAAAGDSDAAAAAEASSAEATEPVEADAPELEADADKATDASVGDDSRDEL